MTERTAIVTGSKGGVGTSTVALNLAVQLGAGSKKRVLLIDLARPFGQISLMLDFEPRFTILDALERIARLDENVLASLALALGMIERQISSAARAGVDTDRIHVVINRCRQNDEDGLAAFEKKHKRSVLARLPNDYRQLTEAVQLGIPLMASAANSLVARYQNLAAWLEARISTPVGDEPLMDQVEGA